MNRNTLLIVDDMEVNRAILRALFEKSYNILEAENGEQGLMLLSQYKDTIAAMLLDIVMPVKDGYAVMAEMRHRGLLGKVPIIVITSEDSMESEVRAFDLGASDIIVKPFEPHVVTRRVQNAVELNLHREHLEELVEKQAVKLRESRDILMDALSSVIEHRSVESGQHILRIRMFTKVLLEDVLRSYPEYDLNERVISVIASASALHDIGKISIPDSILKKPGRLTPEEFAVMKTHSEKGCEILAGLGRMDDKEYLQYAYNICRYHHERWDGRGYPTGLKGDNIPICAQAVGIADAYDALTTDRVYKKAFSPERAYDMILGGECGAFSPKLLACFQNVRESFIELTHSYADGHSPKADSEKLAIAPRPQQGEDQALQYGQVKYAAMLRYANATVLEVDLDTGHYHLAYTANEDFEGIRTGSSYQEDIRLFVDQAVHPDDREVAYSSIDHYAEDFVENGLLKRTRTYRVLRQPAGSYVRYKVTILRMDIHDPHSHKLLVIWKELTGTYKGNIPAQQDGVQGIQAFQDLLIGAYTCLNNHWFTIKEVNQGFLHLFGYNWREIQEIFHTRYIEMIHPDDRQAVINRFQEQMLLTNSIELEYRVLAKDGSIVWILQKCRLTSAEDGSECLNCVLVDITQVKQAQEELRMTMERYQIILNQTNDIIFEWDMAEDSFTYSSNWVKKFGYEPISQHISTRIPYISHILPEDIPSVMELLHGMVSGVPYGETELRIANAEGRYIWCRLRATAQCDNAGRPIKAVGVIVDIDAEKRRVQDLIDQAERDALTGLFNKNAGRSRIQELLKQNKERSAMLIIDLDNFKMVNDTRGHLFGDAVLVEVAAQLQKQFRPQDIFSRIGGDEFLVYLGNAPEKELLSQRAEQLIAVIQRVLADELQDCPLSCSMGAAYYPDNASSFQELFQRCDQALYQAKLLGKSRCCFYDISANTYIMKAHEPIVANTRIESDGTYSWAAGLGQQAFRILYQAVDVEAAIQSILQMLGQKYNVSRVYIFEDFPDGSCCRNTFEWCNQGIASEMDALQRVDYVQLGGNYRENFNEYGIFYCTDISALPKGQHTLMTSQGIHSLLQCAILNDGEFAGFIGFDDCGRNRVWTQSQIDALTFVSELLSVFLLKKRAQDRVLAAAQNLQMVLDSQNSWIYVIDPDTYVLKYINAKTYEIAPQVKPGMLCYEAFFKREKPCEQCPARGIREKANHMMEIFNPVLKVWCLADASYIHWGAQGACLLCCHDITPYKTL